MIKEDLLQYLKEKTRDFQPDSVTFYEFSAAAMAEHFGVRRNTVSHYLNSVLEEGGIIKINTRPVIFLDREVFEKQFFPVASDVYKSLEELWKERETKDIFADIIGYDGSLKNALCQIKISAYYPGSGLPIMLCGPTGAGKSFLAKLIYRYLVAEGVLDTEAPFVVFNCAQYYNNPELLSSNLFGYTKGAFTGADQNTRGMLEEADGGVLFLDEVHRLNEESQEKLFTFMDQGTFRRMGENRGSHRAQVRLVFATTEKLTENFLGTFLRRIPIVITIPGLQERDEKEKLQYIYYFLSQEAKLFGRPIQLSDNILNIFSSYHYAANVGELQNMLRITVAKAYARQRDCEKIAIKLFDLPESLLQDHGEPRENKIRKCQIITITEKTAAPEIVEKKKEENTDFRRIYETMLQLYQRMLDNDISFAEFQNGEIQNVFQLFDEMLFRERDNYSEVMVQYVTSNIQEIFGYLEYTYQMHFNGNSLYTMTYFLLAAEERNLRWNKREKQFIEELYYFVCEQYGPEYKLMQRMVSLIESKVDVSFSKEDEIFLTFYIKSMAEDANQKYMKALILAHGYATASSLANMANRMLGTNIYEAFDMPMDIAVEDITAKLVRYLKENDVSRGILILVDMGSLTEIYERITPYLRGVAGIFDNVSTKMAIYAGDMIKEQLSMEEIVERMKQYNQTTYKIVYPNFQKKRAIIASCMTGMGTAIRLQQLLQDSIPEEAEIRVLLQDYARLKLNGLEDTSLENYEILMIVGTMDPQISGVPYVSLEQLIMGEPGDTFYQVLGSFLDEEILRKINDNLIHCFSLRRVIGTLTILDTEKVLRTVERAICKLEEQLNISLSNNRKIALLVHISCLIERLIRQQEIEYYPELETFLECQRFTVQKMQDCFSVIEKEYSVIITPAEIGYIYDILNAEDGKHEDF